MLDIFIRMLNDPVEMMDDRPGKPEQMLNVLPQILNKRDFLSDDSPKSWAFFFEYGTSGTKASRNAGHSDRKNKNAGQIFPVLNSRRSRLDISISCHMAMEPDKNI
ncbi:MAG: hypothetical protein CW346_06485 [Bacillaceae bacterium]|nr:hypothetical protein [Bacillaceae bacterium]